MQALSAGGHVSFVLVFLEGLLSFFSPCVIPLIPVYIGFLAGSARTLPDGSAAYDRKRTFFHTVCFVLGVSAAFFLLGVSFSAIGAFFSGHRALFTRIGGIVILMMGLVQVGFFELPFLQREHKIHLNLAGKQANPLTAFVMGFAFSFAWTPCVGPALSSVLILASGAKNALLGNLLVLVYAAGFVLPFLALGLFTTQVLDFLKRRRNLLKYTIKAGGILLILIGIMTFTGWMNGVSGYLNSIAAPGGSSASAPAPQSAASSAVSRPQPSSSEPQAASSQPAQPKVAAPDFTLTDQYGNTHTLSDYKGKVVFLNFWATWCPPCRAEMPHIEELYQEYGLNEKDVVFLGVAGPKTEQNPLTQEGSPEHVKQFLTDNSYTFPVVLDESGDVFDTYAIRSFPTTFLIDTEGNLLGYVPGSMTKDVMINVINQAKEGAQ